MTTLRLPWPPSANHLYTVARGRKILSKAGREYHASVALICRGERLTPITGSVMLSINVFPPDKRRRDLSNLIKAVEDGLTQGGAWLDDCQVDHLAIDRRQVQSDGQLVVEFKQV